MALGARLASPLLPGVITYAAALGAFAALKGLSLAEITLMNVMVYAGASQFVALEVWSEPLGLPLIVTMVGVAAAVNLRMILIGASLRPWFSALPVWQVYPALGIVTDPGWLLSMRYHAGGGRDWGIYLGSAALLYAAWVLGTIPGHVLGALVAHPEAWGLDLVMPAFFTALLVPLWKGRAQAAPWGVAAVVSVVVWQLAGGYWFIIAGALAGALVGAFADER
ncbi:branched-chain amino acid ABC transporter permease [Breoghania sp. L-A4]|nr:branched-chain amino acid ABC transporter permease [Breoghania sp. L-A4]